MPKISVVCPVKNEFPWIGYSIMAGMPYIHEFIYAVSPSDDGTGELLDHLKKIHSNIITIPFMDFNPLNQKDYNESFRLCIEASTGDFVWFLHPDMIITDWKDADKEALAWTTEVTSYAGNLQTKITKGRAKLWKNIHAKKFGLHYFGGYGSQNEDFYHSVITGSAYRHYGTEFDKYPFQVSHSGIKVNHYCELKSYARRFEKMKLCLRTQNPEFSEDRIEEMAVNHPRVTLDSSFEGFGRFEFTKVNDPIPAVIDQYKAEFEAFKRKGELVYG